VSTKRDNRAWIQDILASIVNIETYTADLDFDAFTASQQVQHAVLFNIQIIGETANRIDTEFRNSMPSIPWPQMIGMRNVIVHGYFTINLQIVWKTISDELPKLKHQFQEAIAAIDGET
jgi:uncharacterized protein with HEPN domain